MMVGAYAAQIRKQISALVLLILTACAAPTNAGPVPLTVHASSAAYPWLSSVYDCAPASAVILLSDGPEADVVLRLGESEEMSAPAYQIGTDDLIVVTHPGVGVGSLATAQVEALFTGQFTSWSEVGGADLPVQVWAYAPTVDIEGYFERTILHGRPVTSLSHLAVSAQQMSDSAGATPGSIGFLPRRWKAGNTREVMPVSSLPVLALVRGAPEGPLAELLACMQAHP